MSARPRILSLLVSMVGAIALSACGDDAADGTSEADSGVKFPKIVKVVPEETGDGVWAFAVTISSPYDTPERYADGWKVVGDEGEVLGEMTLDHDHASEQPFMRDEPGVEIPEDVAEVTVQGRDLESGYGGNKVTVQLER